MPSLSIDGIGVPVGVLWSHLQRTASCHGFRLFIESAHLVDVFDSFNRGDGDGWAFYVRSQIDELGTFAVEGYLENIRKLMREERGPYEWVVASVEDVFAEDGGLVLLGTVLPFTPHRIDLVPLE